MIDKCRILIHGAVDMAEGDLEDIGERLTNGYFSIVFPNEDKKITKREMKEAIEDAICDYYRGETITLTEVEIIVKNVYEVRT